MTYVPAPFDIAQADVGDRAATANPGASGAPLPDAAAPASTGVPVTKHAVVGGTFAAAYVDVMPPVAVQVTALPFETLPRDQRQDSGTVEPSED